MSKISWLNAQSVNYYLSHLLSLGYHDNTHRLFCPAMFILFYCGPVQTYAFLFENGDFFSRLAYRPHLSGENGHRKHIYSKTFSIDFFENAGHSFTNEGFRIRWCNTSFTTSITHALWGILSYFQCLAFTYGRAKTIRTRYVWTRIFLENERKKISFSKISGYLWTGPACLISARERLNIFYTAASKRFKMNFPRGRNTTMKNKLH